MGEGHRQIEFAASELEFLGPPSEQHRPRPDLTPAGARGAATSPATATTSRGRLAWRDFGNGNRATLQYDANGRLKRIEGPLGAFLAFTLNSAGRATRMERATRRGRLSTAIRAMTFQASRRSSSRRCATPTQRGHAHADRGSGGGGPTCGSPMMRPAGSRSDSGPTARPRLGGMTPQRASPAASMPGARRRSGPRAADRRRRDPGPSRAIAAR